MFEAFVTLCALGADAPCREVLLPGHAAETRAGCEADLAGAAGVLAGLGTAGAPHCAPRPAPGLAFEEVAPGVFVHRGAIAEPGPENGGDVANVAFVRGADGVVVIDAGGSRAVGEQIYLAVRAVTEAPITHLVLTHMHPDHVLGAAPLAEAGAEIVGHAGLARALADRAETYLDRFRNAIGVEGFLGTAVVAPDRGLAEPLVLDLGDRALTLTPRPKAHTTNDLTVTDSESGLLFAGDLVFATHVPTLDGSLPGWRALLEAMSEGETAAAVVPGHGGPVLAWPEGAEPVARYLSVLESDTRAALDGGLSISEAVPEIGQSEAGDWALFGVYNPRNATQAYTELEWE